LDCYDPESRVFAVVAKRIQKGRDVWLILKWKTPLLRSCIHKR
jgi:hypothetical protein